MCTKYVYKICYHCSHTGFYSYTQYCTQYIVLYTTPKLLSGYSVLVLLLVYFSQGVLLSVYSSHCIPPALPSGSWWRKARASESRGRRTWRYSILVPDTPPWVPPRPAPRWLWTHTATPPGRRSLYWINNNNSGRTGISWEHTKKLFTVSDSGHITQCSLKPLYIEMMSDRYVVVLGLQYDMEGTPQGSLSKVTLGPHSQNVRDLRN